MKVSEQPSQNILLYIDWCDYTGSIYIYILLLLLLLLSVYLSRNSFANDSVDSGQTLYDLCKFSGFLLFLFSTKKFKRKKEKKKKKKKKYFAYTNHSLLKTKRASLNHGFIHVTLIRNTMVVMRYCKYKVIQIK